MSAFITRIAGVLVALYGMAGLLMAGMIYLAAEETFVQARAVTETVAQQQADLRNDLDQIARTTGDARTASEGFARSLEQAQLSLQTASEASGRMAASFSQMSTIRNLQVFGLYPFVELGVALEVSGRDFQTFSNEIQRTSSSMGDNVRDVQRLSADLGEIQQRVDRMSANVGQLTLQESLARGISGLQTAVSWIVIWLVAQSLIWFGIGLSVLLALARRQRANRRARLRVAADAPPDLD